VDDRCFRQSKAGCLSKVIGSNAQGRRKRCIQTAYGAVKLPHPALFVKETDGIRE
jgi:hypothetical protein